MSDKPEIACTGCGWVGFGEELLEENQCDEPGEFMCPECMDKTCLIPYDEYMDRWGQYDLEGCPEL